MTTAFRIVDTKLNKAGTPFRLMERNGRFAVFKLSKNYCGQAAGGIAAAWRYILLDVTEAEARQVFARRIKGTAK